MAYKVFTNGSVLNASEINDNLMNQAVMVFSNAAARTAAITTPLEGMLTWLEDSNKYQNYNGSAWVDLGGSGILQLKSTTKTNDFAMTSSTFSDITDFNVTITPRSTSSKIYIVAYLLTSQNVAATATMFRLMRGSTPIGIGDAVGVRPQISGSTYAANVNESMPITLTFLDSPNTTSATTYKVQMRSSVNGQTSTINRSAGDPNSDVSGRSVSTITVMEVAG